MATITIKMSQLINTAQNKKLTINAKLADISYAQKELQTFLTSQGIDSSEHYHITLPMNEALINIIKHTFKNQDQGTIELKFRLHQGILSIHITDYGPPTDPRNFRGRCLNELKPYGLGLHLMRSFMDEVRFVPPEEQPQGQKASNQLVMSKRIHA